MKYSHILMSFFVLLSILDVQAQQYEPPSREQVERLLDEINECKDILDETEEYLKRMEANPGLVTLQQYLDTRKSIEKAKSCIANKRKKLNQLRKEYPGWFNSPRATVSLRKGHTLTSKELEIIYDEIDDLLSSAIERFGNIIPPER